MARKNRPKTYQRAVVYAVLGVALCLSACSGDDDDDASSSGTSGTSGSLNLSGATSEAGSSTGATTSGGSNDEGVPTVAGASGENASVAGSANGGSSIGGSSASGGNGSYLHCASAADCKQYGGGKVCCEQGTMLFCTKPSACTGKTLP
jgi:hypothetical protein